MPQTDEQIAATYRTYAAQIKAARQRRDAISEMLDAADRVAAAICDERDAWERSLPEDGEA